MQSFTSLILERGAASVSELEASIANQLLFGGDIGTNLVEIGALKENALHRLLSEFYEIPIGPQGRLPELSEELAELLPPETARRFGVYPVKRTRRTLHVAVAQPLDAETEKRLRSTVGLQVKPVVVTPLRLAEALSRCGLPMSQRDKRLVELLDAGIKPSRKPNPGRRTPETMMFPESAPYRRMSEHPEGIAPSTRQPRPRPRRAPQLRETTPPRGGSQPVPDTKPPPIHTHPPAHEGAILESVPTHESVPMHESVPAHTTPPDTLDGVGPGESSRAPAPSTYPPDEARASTGGEGKRDTHPYEEAGAEAADETAEKRDTQPWRDDASEDEEAALSVRGEFTASLSEAPPSDEAKIHEEKRRFRHRGPFTRAQAELAVSQAPDVQTVLEILVRYARQFFERSVLLVVQGDRATLRLSHGLSIEWASLTVPLDAPSLVKEAYDSGDPVVRPLAPDGFDAELKRQLKVGDQRVAVVPLCIRERVVALFYGDDKGDGVDKDAVADVTDFAEICAAEIMRVMVHRKRASV